MILSELRDYLKTNQRATLIDMSRRFDTDPNALRGMLAKWMATGKVERLPQGAEGAGGCCKCDPATTEVYVWMSSGRGQHDERLSMEIKAEYKTQ